MTSSFVRKFEQTIENLQVALILLRLKSVSRKSGPKPSLQHDQASAFRDNNTR